MIVELEEGGGGQKTLALAVERQKLNRFLSSFSGVKLWLTLDQVKTIFNFYYYDNLIC